jgi:hypothetical protein
MSENEMKQKEAELEIQQEAKRRHPRSNGIARWGGGSRKKFRICNICEKEIAGTSFCGDYPRTKKSERAEMEHVKSHIKGD